MAKQLQKTSGWPATLPSARNISAEKMPSYTPVVASAFSLFSRVFVVWLCAAHTQRDLQCACTQNSIPGIMTRPHITWFVCLKGLSCAARRQPFRFETVSFYSLEDRPFLCSSFDENWSIYSHFLGLIYQRNKCLGRLSTYRVQYCTVVAFTTRCVKCIHEREGGQHARGHAGSIIRYRLVLLQQAEGADWARRMKHPFVDFCGELHIPYRLTGRRRRGGWTTFVSYTWCATHRAKTGQIIILWDPETPKTPI